MLQKLYLIYCSGPGTRKKTLLETRRKRVLSKPGYLKQDIRCISEQCKLCHQLNYCDYGHDLGKQVGYRDRVIWPHAVQWPQHVQKHKNAFIVKTVLDWNASLGSKNVDKKGYRFSIIWLRSPKGNQSYAQLTWKITQICHFLSKKLKYWVFVNH